MSRNWYEHGPMVKPYLERAVELDWCHLCGRRSAPQVFAQSEANAEHPKHEKGVQRPPANGVRVRICAHCLADMTRALNIDCVNVFEPIQQFEVLVEEPR